MAGRALASEIRREMEDSVAPRRITIVEDDVNIAELLGFLFRREGYAPEIVRDGRAAIEHVREHDAPAALVLDQLLPYRDGLAVASAARADARWSDVPIFLLRCTATAGADAARLVDATVPKPFDPLALVASVTRLVEEWP